MLDAWIIEKIKEKEAEKKEREQLPLFEDPINNEDESVPEKNDRGVYKIDINGDE